MIYYLKTTDEASLWLALETANLAVKDYDPEDELNVRPTDVSDDTLNQEWQPTGAYDWRFTGEALDIIGTIYVESGNMLTAEDGEGNEVTYPEMVAIEGYHANIKAPAGIEGLPEVVAPNTPYRKWMGE
jgi:hypothetical protein